MQNWCRVVAPIIRHSVYIVLLDKQVIRTAHLSITEYIHLSADWQFEITRTTIQSRSTANCKTNRRASVSSLVSDCFHTKCDEASCWRYRSGVRSRGNLSNQNAKSYRSAIGCNAVIWSLIKFALSTLRCVKHQVGISAGPSLYGLLAGRGPMLRTARTSP